MPKYLVRPDIYVDAEDADEAYQDVVQALDEACGCCVDGYSLRRSNVSEMQEPECDATS